MPPRNHSRTIGRALASAHAAALESRCLLAVTSFADIETWVGSGPNEAALVVDWNDGDEPLAWGYRWDGDATGTDMFEAIASADNRFFGKVNDPFTVVFGIGYDRDSDGFSLAGGLSPNEFDQNGLTVATFSTADGSAASDFDDSYREGWLADGYWSQWSSFGSPYAGGSWFSDFGVASPIANGQWQGWSFKAGLDFSVPATAPAQPVAVGNLNPSASLTGPTEVVPGMPAEFSFDLSDFEDSVVDYTLDFGDGTVISATDAPVGSFGPIEHVYSEFGAQTVELTVADSDGGSTTQTLTVDVSPVMVDANDDLFVGAESGSDRITIVPSGSSVRIDVGSSRYTATFADPSDADLFVYGGAGNDTIRLFGRTPGDWRLHVFGGEGNDYIAGGIGDDYLDGGPGNDRLLGGDGNNQLVGGSGDDNLSTNFGDDYLDGGWGRDLLITRGGNNVLIGGPDTPPTGAVGGDDDRLSSGNGDDLLRGGYGNDSLSSRGGENLLLGGVGNDRLSGGRGSDILVGGLGRDSVIGGSGDDVLIDGASATLEELPGSMDVDAALAFYATLQDEAFAGLRGLDAVSDDDVDVLYGLAGADEIRSSGPRDRVRA